MCERDENFNEIHSVLMNMKEVDLETISKEDIQKAIELRNKVIDRISKSDEFKEMFEETYLMTLGDFKDKNELKSR